jgi:hypothetical protein
MTYRIGSDLQSTAADRASHVRALTSVTSSDARQDVFDHLYACLTILDSKSASLLGFNSIITAVFAIFLTQRLTARETFVANLGMAAVLVSAMLLLTVLWIRWATTDELADGGAYALQVLRVRNDRTVRFRVAWYFAIAALTALVLLLILRVSAGAVASVPQVVRPALAAAAPTEAPTRPIDQNLIDAADRGDLDAVRRLLGQGASVRARDARGRTALIAAAYRNHVPVAALLIERGADVNAKDDTVQSAYLISTSEGYVELLRLTLRAGADVRSLDSYNGTGLIRAAHHGHVEVIRELLKTDIDVNHVNRLGWTALLEAIILGNGGPRHTETVRLLVEARADVSLADSRGLTPLAHARQRGYRAIVEILTRAGAR